MSNTVKIISWIMFVVAIAAWVGVGYAAHTIKATAIKRANDTKLAQTKANQTVLNQKVEALAESTKEKRDQLSAIAGADVVSVIDVIDAAGKTAGIEARVSDASVAGQQQLGKTGDTLRGVAFNVQGSGTFVQVMHAAELYEKLPILSSIDSIDIEKVQGSDPKTANLWHISARIRVQTLISVSI